MRVETITVGPFQENTFLVVCTGARDRSTGPEWGGYTVDEAAQRHNAGVEQDTTVPAEAYARFGQSALTRYRGFLRAR